MNNELILYHSSDGRTELQLRAEDGSVWLTQLEMAELFSSTKQNISLHIKNILEEGELPEGATVKESLTVQTEDGEIQYLQKMQQLLWRRTVAQNATVEGLK